MSFIRLEIIYKDNSKAVYQAERIAQDELFIDIQELDGTIHHLEMKNIRTTYFRVFSL